MRTALKLIANTMLWGGGIAFVFDFGLGIPRWIPFVVTIAGGILISVLSHMDENDDVETKS